MLTAETQRKWNESAFYYNKHRRLIEQLYVPLTHTIIQNAKISAGARILDIATGIGEPALSIARTYGDLVSIIATDLIHPMLLAARTEAAKRNYRSVHFCRCSGDALPFINHSFNAIVCRLGFNFFPDPKKSLKHMLRVLNSSGRVVLVLWHDLKFNPVHDVVNQAAEKIFPSKPDPLHDSNLHYDDPGVLANLLVSAGFKSVEENIFDFIMEVSTDLEEFCKNRVEISDPIRDKFAQMSNKQKDELLKAIRNGFHPYFQSGTMRLPAKMIMVTGQK